MLRTTSSSHTPAVPIGVKKEGLAHLASIGGQLATNTSKSVVGQVERRLALGRAQRSLGFFGGLWNEIRSRWLDKAWSSVTSSISSFVPDFVTYSEYLIQRDYLSSRERDTLCLRASP